MARRRYDDVWTPGMSYPISAYRRVKDDMLGVFLLDVDYIAGWLHSPRTFTIRYDQSHDWYEIKAV